MYLYVLIILSLFFLSISNTHIKIRRTFDIRIINACQFLLAISIVLAHLSQYLKVSWLRIFTTCGGWAVPIFFLVSGYGLYYSMLHKNNYLEGFLHKRLSKILFPFLISYFIYLLLYWCNGSDLHSRCFAWQNISLSTLPYSWFVQSITVFYVIFYVSFKFFKNRTLSISLTFFGVICYEIYRLYVGSNPNTFFSGICFPVGMILSYRERVIENLINETKRLCFVLVVIGTSALSLMTYNSFGKVYVSIMFYLLVRIIPERNDFLHHLYKAIKNLKLNKISYEVYLTQGVAFLVLRSKFLYIHSSLCYSVVSVLSVIAIGGGIHGIINFLNKKA